MVRVVLHAVHFCELEEGGDMLIRCVFFALEPPQGKYMDFAQRRKDTYKTYQGIYLSVKGRDLRYPGMAAAQQISWNGSNIREKEKTIILGQNKRLHVLGFVRV